MWTWNAGIFKVVAPQSTRAVHTHNLTIYFTYITWLLYDDDAHIVRANTYIQGANRVFSVWMSRPNNTRTWVLDDAREHNPQSKWWIIILSFVAQAALRRTISRSISVAQVVLLLGRSISICSSTDCRSRTIATITQWATRVVDKSSAIITRAGKIWQRRRRRATANALHQVENA